MGDYYSRYHQMAADAPSTAVQTGVLLVNLGTPEAPTAKAVRPYLAEFLGDRRVIEAPRWLWWLVLHGVILRIRPRRSAHAYAKIWTPEGSPLRVGSERLSLALQQELEQRLTHPPRVALAMRYGRPAVADAIHQLQAQGVNRLLVLPLYPQYSATSTGSVIDAVADAVKRMRYPPALCTINDYHADPAHIEALAGSIENWWQDHGRGDHLLLSFHGIPERYVRAGDPYQQQCLTTAELLRRRLGLEETAMTVSFQSRVGRERWLHPYTDETVRRLGAERIGKLDVACPGFAVDCLETLEEIAMQNRELFIESGGGDLRYIPALNDAPAQVGQLADLVERHTRQWQPA